MELKSLRAREFERRANRMLSPGSYDAAINLLLIDPSLSPEDNFLVRVHEHVHFVLGQLHWGETIRRLDHLAVQTSVPLQMFRGRIILRVLTEVLGRTPSPEDLALISTSRELQTRIREALAADDLFMEGIRLIDDCEHRKHILCSQWISAQEGFAYWAGFTIGRDYFVATRNNDAVKRVDELTTNVANRLPRREAVGVEILQAIALRLDHNFSSVHDIVYVALNPSIAGLRVIDLPLQELRKVAGAPHRSPDKRLSSLKTIVDQRGYVRERDFENLFTELDNDNGGMSVDDFNREWLETVDGHPSVIRLMNALYAQIGVQKQYDPGPIPAGAGSTTEVWQKSPVVQYPSAMDHLDAERVVDDAEQELQERCGGPQRLDSFEARLK